LGEGGAAQQQQGPITHWPDNRIAFDENSAWRYSDQGNRVEQMSQNPQHYERQRLYFDGANQLTALQVDGADGHNPIVMQNAARYIYDALGRRLKKTVRDSTGKDHITYFGWDGDRQVHTETMKEDGTREIVHIIYEPGTFTPMVRLSTAVGANAWQPKPHFIVQAALAGLTQRQKNNDEIWADLQSLQNALERMADEKSDQLNKNFRRALRQDPPTNRLVGLGPRLDNMMTIEDMRRGLQEQEAQEIKTPIVVHYFHTDHLGTPLALTDQQGKITWATRLDPWGNIEDEYNPHGMEQNIRLPGQYYDRETGLYYNRHRYYDPKIGGYINQDPIGLAGGVNFYVYVKNKPNRQIDPRGLQEVVESENTVRNEDVAGIMDAESDAIDPSQSVKDFQAQLQNLSTYVQHPIDSIMGQSPPGSDAVYQEPDLTGVDIYKNNGFTCPKDSQIDLNKLLNAMKPGNTPSKFVVPPPGPVLKGMNQ
jgi:RHS repeat-associated protein